MAYIKSKKHGEAGVLKGTALASALALALPAGMAMAADAVPADATVLPSVKVEADGIAPTYKADKASSPKQTQPLLDTPQTIVVVKKELLQEQAATTLSEALRNTPGITMLLGENGNTATGDSIFMRGFDTQSSIYVDGIRDLGTISRDTFNTEQVEIVKGPSGADNGRGAASGYVNLSSKLASRDEMLAGNVTVGTAEYKRVTADLNRALSIDGAALRINAMVQDAGVDGRDVVESKRWGLASSLAFGLGSPTRAYLNLLHTEQNNIPDGGVPTIGLAGYYHASLSSPAAAVDSSNFYGSTGDYDDVLADMVTLRLEHDFSDAITLRNTTRFGQSKQDTVLTGVNTIYVAADATYCPAGLLADPSSWCVRLMRQGKDIDNSILINQTNLNASFDTAGYKHELSAGVELSREEQDSRTQAAAYNQGGNLYKPNPNGSFAAVAPSGATSDGKTSTVAAYAFDTLNLNERWELTAGLRVEHFNTEYSSKTSANVVTDLELSDKLFSWKLGTVYKPAANGSIYFTYATSQLPPGGSNFTLSAEDGNANNLNLAPQKARNIELGTKWDVLANKLAVTAAIYRAENENEISQTGTGGTYSYSQVGKKRVDGLELGAAGIVMPNWQVSAGLAYMDTKIVKGSNYTNTSNVLTNTEGADINWSPKLTFTTWNTFKLPRGFTAGLGLRYVDSVTRSTNQALSSTTSSMLSAPSYWVIDVMGTYELNQHVNLQLNVYNLLDKEYIASLNNSGARYTPGTPRSAKLSANFLF